MTNLEILTALDDAIRIIHQAKVDCACGSTTIWRIVHHAEEYLDAQIKALLLTEAA